MTNHTLAERVLTDQLDLSCSQSPSYVLSCSYRPVDDVRISQVSIELADGELFHPPAMDYPMEDSLTAVFFLVDSSDPARQDVIDKNIQHIEKILVNSGGHHIFGLGTFDKELQIRATLGTPPGEIISIVRNIGASGLTTELYRNVIRAIELLGETQADRKVLFLFSDGQAEDQAYFHDDVIDAARQHNVVINSLGFARTTSLSVALQTLRRLSEETGGRYLEADSTFDLEGSFFSAPFANIDRGGSFTFNPSDFRENLASKSDLSINFTTISGNLNVSLPVDLPNPEKPQLPIQPSAVNPDYLESGQLNTVQATSVLNAITSDRTNIFLWYGLVAMMILFTIMITVTFFQLRNQREFQATNNLIAISKRKPLAYLITQNEEAKRFPVTHSIWRIGRSMDNEMSLDDHSISRRHAEIHRENNGQFYVYDRESTNGVYVNNRKVIKHRLSEGDIIEIGDILLRFTQHPNDYHLVEQTSKFRARLPEVS